MRVVIISISLNMYFTSKTCFSFSLSQISKQITYLGLVLQLLFLFGSTANPIWLKISLEFIIIDFYYMMLSLTQPFGYHILKISKCKKFLNLCQFFVFILSFCLIALRFQGLYIFSVLLCFLFSILLLRFTFYTQRLLQPLLPPHYFSHKLGII